MPLLQRAWWRTSGSRRTCEEEHRRVFIAVVVVPVFVGVVPVRVVRIQSLCLFQYFVLGEIISSFHIYVDV